MNHPYLFVAGVFLIGLQFPEYVFVAFHAKCNWLFNWISGLAFALIAASFAL